MPLPAVQDGAWRFRLELFADRLSLLVCRFGAGCQRAPRFQQHSLLSVCCWHIRRQFGCRYGFFIRPLLASSIRRHHAPPASSSQPISILQPISGTPRGTKSKRRSCPPRSSPSAALKALKHAFCGPRLFDRKRCRYPDLRPQRVGEAWRSNRAIGHR